MSTKNKCKLIRESCIYKYMYLKKAVKISLSVFGSYILFTKRTNYVYPNIGYKMVFSCVENFAFYTIVLVTYVTLFALLQYN